MSTCMEFRHALNITVVLYLIMGEEPMLQRQFVIVGKYLIGYDCLF